MSDEDEIRIVRPHPREVETIPIEIPVDALAKIRDVARRRDMSPEALIRFYIGQGLRADLAQLDSERVLDAVERVLARHDVPADERTAIQAEIRRESAVPNSTTRSALQAAQERRGLRRYAGPDDLFLDLGIAPDEARRNHPTR